MTHDTPEQFEAITWFNSLTPAEAIELRDKYRPHSRMIDMSKETIVGIWQKAKEDKHYSFGKEKLQS